VRLIFLSFCLLCILNALAQDHKFQNDTRQEKKGLTTPTIYTYVEQMPSPGYDLGKYLSEHLKYPDSAYNHDVQGRVVVRFIVNEDGSISDCNVIKGIGGGCDEEATRVISKMPAWLAGVHDGAKVKVYFTMPIAFTLEEKTQVKHVVTNKEPTVYLYVDEPPYPEYSIRNYFRDNFHCREPWGGGTVRIVVNEDGSISDPSVIRGIDIGCRDELYRILKNMPHWKPPKQNGKPVKSYYTLSFDF